MYKNVYIMYLNYDCILEICKKMNDISTIEQYICIFNIKNFEIDKHLYNIRYSSVLRELKSKEILVNFYGDGKIRLLSKPFNIKKLLNENYCHLC